MNFRFSRVAIHGSHGHVAYGLCCNVDGGDGGNNASFHAPVAILWTRSILRQQWNAVAYYRIALFVFGYLLAWAFAGALAFFGLAEFEQILVLAGSHGRWPRAAIFAIAGVYQLTSFKDVCLRHCRSRMSLLAHYISFRGPAIDIRVGRSFIQN
jgi:predicted metal-binding membrane protein